MDAPDDEMDFDSQQVQDIAKNAVELVVKGDQNIAY